MQTYAAKGETAQPKEQRAHDTRTLTQPCGEGGAQRLAARSCSADLGSAARKADESGGQAAVHAALLATKIAKDAQVRKCHVSAAGQRPAQRPVVVVRWLGLSFPRPYRTRDGVHMRRVSVVKAAKACCVAFGDSTFPASHAAAMCCARGCPPSALRVRAAGAHPKQA